MRKSAAFSAPIVASDAIDWRGMSKLSQSRIGSLCPGPIRAEYAAHQSRTAWGRSHSVIQGPHVARRLAALAVGAAIVSIACPTASALPAFRAESGNSGTASGAASRPAPAELTTTQQSFPKPGSRAARRIGGPLMASGGVVVNEPSDDPRPLPDIPASAWVIANADTGQVLAAKDPHGEFGPASTLKVLTAVTLIPLLNPNAMVVATPLATSQQPTSAFLITGREYRVSDLFRALLLISANDAAVALTQATGSFAKGMALINGEARHLQAYDVVAKLPNGLPAAGQVTSAYDEALIARQALAIPAFMKYDSTLEARLELKPRDWETLVNQNYLLTQYRGGIGGKIGWTVSSEATYVGLARRNGVTLIATVLHCTSLQEITSAEQLLNWGFAMNGKVRPVGELVPPLPAPAPPSPLDARSAAKPKTVALAEPQPAAGGSAASYGLAAGGVIVAGLGLVALIRTRRRTLAARRRPQLHHGPATSARSRTRPTLRPSWSGPPRQASWSCPRPPGRQCVTGRETPAPA
jgi:serine-type D-Ala-D-Ala carboxypeptidase (penicillin-binding protein 5/6)